MFYNLDLFTGYQQVLLCEYSKEKTKFFCCFGTFELDAMNFGVMNTSSSFQRMMGQIIAGLSFVNGSSHFHSFHVCESGWSL